MRNIILTVALLFTIIAVAAAVMFMPQVTGRYIWNPFDYARIIDLDYKAILEERPAGGRGSVTVTERVTFDVHAFSEDNPFWELHRPLPEWYSSNILVRYRVNAVVQILDDGRRLVYNESSKKYESDSEYTGGHYTGDAGPNKWFHDNMDTHVSSKALLIYVDGLYRETVTFEIEYEVFNADILYEDATVLTFMLFNGPSARYLKSVKGQILIPESIMPGAGNYSIYTYGTNFNSFPYLLSLVMNPGYTTFFIELSEAHLMFSPYNSRLEFTVVSYGDDKLSLAVTRAEHINSYNEMLSEIRQERERYEALPEQYRLVKYIILAVSTFFAFLIGILAIRENINIRRKNKFYSPIVRIKSTSKIPVSLDFDTNIGLDACFAAILVFCKHSVKRKLSNEFMATMLSLARKGYIDITKIINGIDWDVNNAGIVIINQPKHSPPEESFYDRFTDLTPVEKQYFNMIVHHQFALGGYNLPLTSLLSRISSDYKHTYNFIRDASNSIHRIGIKGKYITTSLFKRLKEQTQHRAISQLIIGLFLLSTGNLVICQTRLDLAFGSFFILGGGFIISAIFKFILAPHYVLLTQLGEDEYERWCGLYNYLRSKRLYRNSRNTDISTWEQYLVYATAFGVSANVIKAINANCPNTVESPILANDSFFQSKAFKKFAGSFDKSVDDALYAAKKDGNSDEYKTPANGYNEEDDDDS